MDVSPDDQSHGAGQHVEPDDVVDLILYSFALLVGVIINNYVEFNSTDIRASATENSTINLSLALFVVAVFVWLVKRRNSSLLAAAVAIAIWASIPPIVAHNMTAAGFSKRETWASVWYWSLKPLPIDFATPTGWVPAVDAPDTNLKAAFVATQAATIFLLLGALALLVSAMRSQGWLRSTADTVPIKRHGGDRRPDVRAASGAHGADVADGAADAKPERRDGAAPWFALACFLGCALTLVVAVLNTAQYAVSGPNNTFRDASDIRDLWVGAGVIMIGLAGVGLVLLLKQRSTRGET